MLFWATFYLVHKLANVFSPTYRDMLFKKKADYLSRWVAILHGFVAAILAFVGCFCLCEREDESIFTDYECLITPKNLH